MNILSRLLLACLCLLLLSCIEGEEEMWIESDGSSRAEIRLKLPRAAKRRVSAEFEDFGRLVEQIDGARLAGPEFTDLKNGQVHMTCQMHLDSPTAGKELYDRCMTKYEPEPGSKRSPTAAMLGTVEVGFESLAATLHRRIHTSELLPLTNSSERARKRNQRLLGDSALKYTLHLPNPAISSNAHASREGGRTLEWTFPLYEYLDQDADIHLTWRPPIPWWAWPLGALAILLPLLLIFLLVRRFRRRKHSP